MKYGKKHGLTVRLSKPARLALRLVKLQRGNVSDRELADELILLGVLACPDAPAAAKRIAVCKGLCPAAAAARDRAKAESGERKSGSASSATILVASRGNGRKLAARATKERKAA
jgi:hypothetical protein